ncbi:helix-turn-helix transcriptional regulator [Psychrobacillus sp. FSL K6-2684]|uniref:helix-turn-helix domain-containing protein n=1 Tax=Psychrobacillus sp. FSL K6-2684 TaxID=2921547 RepID=UPI0030F62221
MDSLVKLVGINIKQIRKSKELTQDELAEKCGLQTSYLAGVERGDRNITLQTLEKIIVGLDVSPIHIFNFASINIDKKHLKKQEILMLLKSMIENRSEEEIRLILNIATDIFNTYK